MHVSACKRLKALENQLIAMTAIVQALHLEHAAVADSRRVSCKKAYHRDVKKTRVSRNAYYQRIKSDLSAKVGCDLCGRQVRTDYLVRHQKTPMCMKHRSTLETKS